MQNTVPQGVEETPPRVPPGESSGAKWDAGIDWVTFIARTPRDTAQLARTARSLVDKYREPTTKRLTFKCGGYEGWHLGPIRLGFRGLSSMLQLSSTAAAESWGTLASCGGQPTRLDIQVTYSPSVAHPRFGRRFIRPVQTQTLAPLSSRPRCGLSMDSDGLFLGTVGRRTKPRYLRVYDKGVELGTAPPGHLWRMEVEAKGTLAPRLWEDLKQAPNTREWCWNSCAEQWKLSGYSWPLSASSRGSRGITIPTKVRPEVERLAEWLRLSVRPAVARMRRAFTDDEIMAMLGMDLPPDTDHDDEF